MTSVSTPSMSFKASIGSRQVFLPARAPVAARVRQVHVVAAKIPGLKNKNNIAKVCCGLKTSMLICKAELQPCYAATTLFKNAVYEQVLACLVFEQKVNRVFDLHVCCLVFVTLCES